VTLSIERRTTGRKVGSRCLKDSRSRRKRRKCTRYVAAGTLTRAGRQGKNKLAFSGRVGRKALPPGVYRANLSAVDVAGNTSTKRTVAFKVVPR
jgi:hypothetical protein